MKITDEVRKNNLLANEIQNTISVQIRPEIERWA
jgi:hypothetical protein